MSSRHGSGPRRLLLPAERARRAAGGEGRPTVKPRRPPRGRRAGTRCRRPRSYSWCAARARGARGGSDERHTAPREALAPTPRGCTACALGEGAAAFPTGVCARAGGRAGRGRVEWLAVPAEVEPTGALSHWPRAHLRARIGRLAGEARKQKDDVRRRRHERRRVPALRMRAWRPAAPNVHSGPSVTMCKWRTDPSSFLRRARDTVGVGGSAGTHVGRDGGSGGACARDGSDGGGAAPSNSARWCRGIVTALLIATTVRGVRTAAWGHPKGRERHAGG